MKPAQKIFVVLILIFFVFFYLFRLHRLSSIEIPENEVVILRGRVSQQPYLKGSYQVISLSSVVIKTDRFPGFFYGEKIEVTGKFEKKVINPFQTSYYAYFPTIRRVEEEKKLGFLTSFKLALYCFRGRLETTIAQLLPEPQASLLMGVLLGAKKEMPENFLKNLRDTGTLHIVVASGYNLSVVAGFLVSGLVWFVSRKKALFFAFLGIVFYSLMVGAEPPVVRAAIMASLAFGAEYLGRPRSGLVGLMTAGSLMILLSPLILFDIGFQLSLMATAGILLIFPLLRELKFFRLPVLGDGLATTLSAQIGVTPILLANFGNFSCLSPLINALILPLIPLLMNMGGITVLFGLVSKPVAKMLAILLWLPLTYFVKLVEWFGNLTWINLQIESLSLWWGMGYYLVLGIILWRFWRKRWSLKQPGLF
jgi:competence protein ComEC